MRGLRNAKRCRIFSAVASSDAMVRSSASGCCSISCNILDRDIRCSLRSQLQYTVKTRKWACTQAGPEGANVWLEVQFHGQLHDSRIARAADCVVRRRGQAERRAADWSGVIEGVERLQPELTCQRFCELYVLEYCQVGIPETRTANGAGAFARQRSLRRGCSGESGGVEPVAENVTRSVGI